MEQQLIQTERLAAMGQMIAGVAHELNNPLTAVLGVTELSARFPGRLRDRAVSWISLIVRRAAPPRLCRVCSPSPGLRSRASPVCT